MSLVRSRTLTVALSLVCLVLLYIALSGETWGGVRREEVIGGRETEMLNDEIIRRKGTEMLNEEVIGKRGTEKQDEEFIGKKQIQKPKEVVVRRKDMSKFYKRNEKIRSEFKTSLDKIKSTCSKYATSNNSSVTRLPPSKHFSLGWYTDISNKTNNLNV